MKHLYFVRHGTSVMNQRGVFSSSSDTPLSDEGKAEAVGVGQALKSVGIDCIVSSPMGRTLETARLIAGQLGFDPAKIVTVQQFTERDFGPLEGTAYQRGLTDKTAGAESREQLLARVKRGLDRIQKLDCDTILVVSHGAVGWALYHCLDPLPSSTPPPYHNAQVVQLL